MLVAQSIALVECTINASFIKLGGGNFHPSDQVPSSKRVNFSPSLPSGPKRLPP